MTEDDLNYYKFMEILFDSNYPENDIKCVYISCSLFKLLSKRYKVDKYDNGCLHILGRDVILFDIDDNNILSIEYIDRKERPKIVYLDEIE